MRCFRELWTHAYAAAVVGLETEAFLEKIRENIGLQNIGLSVLDSSKWEYETGCVDMKVSDDIIFALDFPESQVDKSIAGPGLLTGWGCSYPRLKPPCRYCRGVGQKPQYPDYCGGDGKIGETLVRMEQRYPRFDRDFSLQQM